MVGLAVDRGAGLVNTAVAFTVWAHTHRVLAAYESAALNTTMTVQVALLAFVFLHEPLGARRWLATVVVAAATLLVQLAAAGGVSWMAAGSGSSGTVRARLVADLLLRVRRVVAA